MVILEEGMVILWSTHWNTEGQLKDTEILFLFHNKIVYFFCLFVMNIILQKREGITILFYLKLSIWSSWFDWLASLGFLCVLFLFSFAPPLSPRLFAVLIHLISLPHQKQKVLFVCMSAEVSRWRAPCYSLKPYAWN